MKIMSKKRSCYVVWVGRNTGIFKTWDEVKESTNGYPNSEHMGFDRLHQAERAFKVTYLEAFNERHGKGEPDGFSIDDFM
jgi:ribonuclease HI